MPAAIELALEDSCVLDKRVNTAAAIELALEDGRVVNKHVNMAAAIELAQGDSPLINLAPEIRTRIFEFALINGPGMSIDREPKRQLPRAALPALLQTCKRIEREGAPIWYGRNRFYYDRTNSLITWLDVIGPKGRGMLRKVRCGQFFRTTFTADFYLKALYSTMEEEGVKQVGETFKAVAVKSEVRSKDGKRYKAYARNPRHTLAKYATVESEVLDERKKARKLARAVTATKPPAAEGEAFAAVAAMAATAKTGTIVTGPAVETGAAEETDYAAEVGTTVEQGTVAASTVATEKSPSSQPNRGRVKTKAS
ncbi:hypothetical protein B0A50_00611 [Salinomyces thailandicus]|uniref:Uncharacterized protein n=1 Tax=Salinomyces thailandicus TaxID=706561 RepID=A0A4U0UGZ6_9PEZI|nr:hypothetical protein B0A50_00611 [Salinomyces thailandica]